MPSNDEFRPAREAPMGLRPLVTIDTFRANDCRGEAPVSSLLLKATRPFPEDVDDYRALHAAQAIVIADALWTILPGGTMDRLVAELLRRTASDLAVAHGRTT